MQQKFSKGLLKQRKATARKCRKIDRKRLNQAKVENGVYRA